MITLLEYLVVAAVIGLIVFFIAVGIFGRGEQLAPLSPRTSPAELPDRDITSADVKAVRFSMALRGYRMSDVDWTLERLGEQLDNLREENKSLRFGSVSAPIHGSELVLTPSAFAAPDLQVKGDTPDSVPPGLIAYGAGDPVGPESLIAETSDQRGLQAFEPARPENSPSHPDSGDSQ